MAAPPRIRSKSQVHTGSHGDPVIRLEILADLCPLTSLTLMSAVEEKKVVEEMSMDEFLDGGFDQLSDEEEADGEEDSADDLEAAIGDEDTDGDYEVSAGDGRDETDEGEQH